MPTTKQLLDRETHIAGYEADMMSGRVFRLHASGAASRFGYQPPSRSGDWADAVGVLAKHARKSDKQAKLAQAVIRSMTVHATQSQIISSMWDSVVPLLDKGFFDTVGAASPEPGRRRDHEKGYTLGDRLSIYTALLTAEDKFPEGRFSIGWCAQALMDREVAEGRLPHWYLTTPPTK